MWFLSILPVSTYKLGKYKLLLYFSIFPIKPVIPRKRERFYCLEKKKTNKSTPAFFTIKDTRT